MALAPRLSRRDHRVPFTALLLSWVVAGSSSEVSASLYWCTDAGGARILTDTPAQLQSCTIIEISSAESGPLNSHRLSAPSAPEPKAAVGVPPPPFSTATPVRAVAPVAIPLRRVGPLFVVTMRVNGEHEAQLILDTGASHTVLSRDLATRAGVLSSASNGVTMNTVGGPVQAEVVRVNSIRPALFGGDIVTRQIHHWAMWFFILFSVIHVYLVFYPDHVEGRGEISSMGGGWKFIEEEFFEKDKPHTPNPEKKE